LGDRKWAKSTLVLVPLFGVHYTVYCIMHGADGLGEAVEVALLVSDQLFASFQVTNDIQSKRPIRHFRRCNERLFLIAGIFGGPPLLPDERRGARRTFPSLEAIPSKSQFGLALVAVQHHQQLEVIFFSRPKMYLSVSRGI
jgi:hypothetical protein